MSELCVRCLLPDEEENLYNICSDAFVHTNRTQCITRLREQLAAVEAKRDALHEQLTQQAITMTAEHQRAERILALLREPSEAVLQAAGHEVLRYVDPNEGDMRSAIIAAVAAAEQETSHD